MVLYAYSDVGSDGNSTIRFSDIEVHASLVFELSFLLEN